MDATKLFSCQVITPERVLYDGLVSGVQLCASEGQLEVCYGHEPFIANIMPGIVSIKGAKNEQLEVLGGVMSVEFDRCVIITTDKLTGEDK